MMTMSVFVLAAIFVNAGSIKARCIDKDVAGSRYASKVFDYYDVAKGNVPSYMLTGDKQFDEYEEDREPIKIGQLSDNLRDMIKQDSLSEHSIANSDSEIQPETLDAYEDYADGTINKPLGVPVSSPEKSKFVESKLSKSNSAKETLIVDSGFPKTFGAPPAAPEKQPLETAKLTLTGEEEYVNALSESQRATEGVSDTFSTTKETIIDADVIVSETVKPLCDDTTEAPKTE